MLQTNKEYNVSRGKSHEEMGFTAFAFSSNSVMKLCREEFVNQCYSKLVLWQHSQAFPVGSVMHGTHYVMQEKCACSVCNAYVFMINVSVAIIIVC